jgi:hypothetical protein
MSPAVTLLTLGRFPTARGLCCRLQVSGKQQVLVEQDETGWELNS